MAIDRWFIGGGAEHTQESVRRALYASTSGATGVGGVNDLRVRPLAVPGQGIRVAVGSALIKSNYVGGETQTYMGTVYTEEIVDVTPTGSGSGRADLVVMRVEDPFAAGSPYDPPLEDDIATAPYIYIRVISGVPANAKKLQDVPGYQNDTAITLARINLPASTGTVTAAMITDLRSVAQPQRLEVVYARPRVSEDDGAQSFLGSSSENGEYFPGGAGFVNAFNVDVPEWATRAVFSAKWMSINYAANRDPYGRFWIEYSGGGETRITQHFRFNSPGVNNNSSDNWLLDDEVFIPAAMRGRTINVRFKARYDHKPGGVNSVNMTALGGLSCHIVFAEQAIEEHML